MISSTLPCLTSVTKSENVAGEGAVSGGVKSCQLTIAREIENSTKSALSNGSRLPILPRRSTLGITLEFRPLRAAPSLGDASR